MRRMVGMYTVRMVPRSRLKNRQINPKKNGWDVHRQDCPEEPSEMIEFMLEQWISLMIHVLAVVVDML